MRRVGGEAPAAPPAIKSASLARASDARLAVVGCGRAPQRWDVLRLPDRPSVQSCMHAFVLRRGPGARGPCSRGAARLMSRAGSYSPPSEAYLVLQWKIPGRQCARVRARGVGMTVP